MNKQQIGIFEKIKIKKKKVVWKDNTTPPTNYIWMRTDASGNVIGVYEYINGSWTKVAAARGLASSNGTITSSSGEIPYYSTMEQGSAEVDLSGVVYRDENGVAQVATLPEDSSQWRDEDIVNVSTMQTYVDGVVDNVASDVVESEQFNEMVTQIIQNSEIVSSDPEWVYWK